ncbi:hypothetical protein Dimus_031144 [Dionaea muscipula]
MLAAAAAAVGNSSCSALDNILLLLHHVVVVVVDIVVVGADHRITDHSHRSGLGRPHVLREYPAFAFAAQEYYPNLQHRYHHYNANLHPISTDSPAAAAATTRHRSPPPVHYCTT